VNANDNIISVYMDSYQYVAQESHGMAICLTSNL